MDSLTAHIESDSAVDAQETNDDLATWNRPRTTEELRMFIEVHHALIPDAIDVE